MNYFNVQKKLGFGCMRLPMKDDKVVVEEFQKMVDTFMEKGFNYFDTAHGYLEGKSELALRECLTSRHPRESYVLTNKLSNMFFEKEEEIRPFFEKQLELCGVDYFDFYLMHAQNAVNFEKYKRCRAYEIALELKEEGKVKHVGLSFHDKADVLDRILTEYPQMEVVQIQFNYLDYESPAVEARKCYEVCRRHGKPVIIMEPVKGGNLAKLPEEAAKILEGLGGGSAASYAIRFAAGFEGVMSVLSGMGNLEMVLDNTGFMDSFKPLDEREKEAIRQVVDVFKTQNTIACTGCEYCVSSCPQKINIPALFACMNSKRTMKNWNADFYYNSVHTAGGGKASSCIKCGKCEKECPQYLPIRDLLEDVAREFEKK